MRALISRLAAGAMLKSVETSLISGLVGPVVPLMRWVPACTITSSPVCPLIVNRRVGATLIVTGVVASVLKVRLRIVIVPTLVSTLRLPAPGTLKTTSSVVALGTALLVQLLAVPQKLSVAPFQV